MSLISHDRDLCKTWIKSKFKRTESMVSWGYQGFIPLTPTKWTDVPSKKWNEKKHGKRKGEWGHAWQEKTIEVEMAKERSWPNRCKNPESYLKFQDRVWYGDLVFYDGVMIGELTLHKTSCWLTSHPPFDGV